MLTSSAKIIDIRCRYLSSYFEHEISAKNFFSRLLIHTSLSEYFHVRIILLLTVEKVRSFYLFANVYLVHYL